MKKNISPYEKIKRQKTKIYTRIVIPEKIQVTNHFNERREERINKTELKTKRDMLGGIRSWRILVDDRKDKKFYKVGGNLADYILGDNLEIITIYKHDKEKAKKAYHNKYFKQLSKERRLEILKRFGIVAQN